MSDESPRAFGRRLRKASSTVVDDADRAHVRRSALAVSADYASSRRADDASVKKTRSAHAQPQAAGPAGPPPEPRVPASAPLLPSSVARPPRRPPRGGQLDAPRAAHSRSQPNAATAQSAPTAPSSSASAANSAPPSLRHPCQCGPSRHLSGSARRRACRR